MQLLCIKNMEYGKIVEQNMDEEEIWMFYYYENILFLNRSTKPKDTNDDVTKQTEKLLLCTIGYAHFPSTVVQGWRQSVAVMRAQKTNIVISFLIET